MCETLMIEDNMYHYEVATAVAQGVVDQANYLGALGTAIFGATVALCLQFKLVATDARSASWPYAFWIGSFFAIPTIGLVFVVSGLVIEIAPVLYAFEFCSNLEFSEQKFGDTRIGDLKWFSRIQVCTFVALLISSGAFVLRNIVPQTNRGRGE